jgi:hypothetical protein
MGNRLSKEAENKLLHGLVKVAELINGGDSPNEAITKVASAEMLPPGHIRLMVNAYNTGRTNRQRSSHSGLFDKAADFELADAAEIVNKIFPPDVKTAAFRERISTVSEEYDSPPDWFSARINQVPMEKAAFCFADEAPPAYPRYTDSLIKNAHAKLANINREREVLYEKLASHNDDVSSAYGSLCHYFKGLDSVPLEEAREHSRQFYGPAAEAVFAKLAADPCCTGKTPMKIKRPKIVGPEIEEQKPKKIRILKTAMNRSAEPYTLVERMLKTATLHQELFSKIAQFEEAAVDAELRLGRAMSPETPAPLPASNTLSVLKRLSGEKRAFAPFAGAVGHGMQLGIGAAAGNSLMEKLLPEPTTKLRQDAVMDMLDPSHEAQLRAIRAKATLHGILNGPYFEGENPHKVTDLFNNLTKLSPRMAEQPMLLESAMKRLAAQGSADPHDLDQLVGIEGKLKKLEGIGEGDANVASMTAPEYGSSFSTKKKEE